MNRYLLSAVFFFFAVARAPGQETISGKVAETMDAGGYTYFKVAQGSDFVWVASGPQKTKVGDVVSFKAGAVMTDFYSKTLKRTFKKIVFSDGPVKGGTAAPAGKSAPSHGSKPALLTVKVAKAEGPDAYTVSEIFSRRKELAGKTVLVRGKVVKVSMEIMDRNWVHLQDGTGDPKAATHNLLVTTSEMAAVDEMLTARGTVSKDKDFGSGYKYTVLLEKATFKR